MATNSPPSGSSSCLFSNVSIRPLETRFPCSDHHDPRDPHHARWKDSATLGRIWNRESGTPEFKAPCAPRRLSRRQAPKQESDTHCAVSLVTRPGGRRSGRTAPLRLDGPSSPFPCSSFHFLPISIILAPSAPVPTVRLENVIVTSRQGPNYFTSLGVSLLV